ncbi:MAG: DUF4258 domain-containing protein [Anaerolineales bacterium]|nr:DUF4258 domain-containing protein [Anaerolineales bacterium]
MTERNISVDDVAFVIENGEIIREYLDDTPYPSCLMLAWRDDRPLHVVTAENLTDSETIIITAYEPDPAIWEADFKKKRV